MTSVDCPICGELVHHADAPTHRMAHRLETDALTNIAQDVRALRNIAVILLIVNVVAVVILIRDLLP